MKSVKYILLDLGGVLYGVDYGLTLQGLGLSAEALPALLQDPTLAAYEKGELSTEAFLQGWKNRFPHLTERDLIDAWNAMLLGPLPEAEKVLQILASSYSLALLSNTNDLHLTIVEPHIAPWRKYFVEVFFSNRISRRKPEPAAYRYVLDELGWQPQNTLFIDDNSLNVQAAQALGCLGYCIARNQPELILRQLGLYD